jgi:serine protease Do
MAVLEDIGARIGALGERLGPSIVGLARGSGRGSGVVIGDGRVLTAAHAVRGDEVALVFADGRREHGELAGVDTDADLAVIAVDTGEAPAVAWPSADTLSLGLGAPVVALANPGGRGLRATLGFVSAAGRSFRGPRGRRIEGAIEHTAPLPRGSSGGPVVDLDGRLVGINALRREGGLILAVPVGARERERIEALGRGERRAPWRLGVAVAPPHVARRLRRAVGLPEREGVLVRAVEPESPAARAGLERGDLLALAAGRPIDSVDALYDVLDEVGGDRALELTIVRGTEERELSVAFEVDDSGQEAAR